ncbi:hypothetical protein HYALB_00006314 [Hymenoscyphus albidus]|uniref:Uncharacterized protein n=1 Tax=Hymenoscyphus albidus TaxID=595503 RepID=A0A9N9Q3G5_9HELO|nr:hypothetical protein HYALB_00006314 [Hymenoscyphus albidus]
MHPLIPSLLNHISTFNHSYDYPQRPSTPNSHPLLPIFGCVMSPTTVCLNQLVAKRYARWSESPQFEVLRYLYTKLGLRETYSLDLEGNRVFVERYKPALGAMRERFGFLGNVDYFARVQVGYGANEGFVPPTPPTFSKLLKDHGPAILEQYARSRTFNPFLFGILDKNSAAAIRPGRSLLKDIWTSTSSARSPLGIHGKELGNMMHGYDEVPVELFEENDTGAVSMDDGKTKAGDVMRLARRLAAYLAAWTWDFALPGGYYYPSDLR